MKNKRKKPRRKWFYPKSVFDSLKGDKEACWKYIIAKDMKTRRARKKAKEVTREILELLKD